MEDMNEEGDEDEEKGEVDHMENMNEEVEEGMDYMMGEEEE